MYESFYSLTHQPFGKELKTRDAYQSNSIGEAEARLKYLLKTRGVGLITGEPGSGKTFTLRCFADTLSPSLYKVIYFPLSTGTVMDFYRGFTYGLGETPRFRKVDLFHQIQSAVQTSFKDRRITPVFILDEMQMAKDIFLHDLGILFNFQMDSENPFLLILAGLPHLNDRLSLNQNRPLRQRVVMQYRVEPLTRDEVAGYVQHHMKLAGARYPVFTEPAIEAIAACTMGWPRLINNLANSCLLCGRQESKKEIDEEIVRVAAEEAGL